MDTLRSARNQTFLTVNSALLVAAGLVITASEKLWLEGVVACVVGTFGVAVSWVWKAVQGRHNAYIRFHRAKLVALETIVTSTTFTEQTEIFRPAGGTRELSSAVNRFALMPGERRRASVAEARLPLFILGLWLVAIAGGVIAICMA